MKTLLIPSTITLLTLSAHSAVITWSDGSDILSATAHQNISTWGSHVEAFNLGPGSTHNVNTGTETITFIGTDAILPNGGFPVGAALDMASPSPDWVNTINDADWSDADPHTITLTGLTNGSLYQIDTLHLRQSQRHHWSADLSVWRR